MPYKSKLIPPQSEYIKALIWFRGGSAQDNTDYFNINKASSTDMKLLNTYLERYKQYTKGDKQWNENSVNSGKNGEWPEMNFYGFS